MMRTQIQLPEETYRSLRKWAQGLGISISEAIRRCIAERLVSESREGRKEKVRKALEVCGKYRDPVGTGIAEAHDRHLADAFRQ